MLVVKEFAFLLASEARELGVPLVRLGNPDEVGLLFAEDSETGQHHTLLGAAESVRRVIRLNELGVNAVFSPESMPLSREGWPDEWVGAQTASGQEPKSRRSAARIVVPTRQR